VRISTLQAPLLQLFAVKTLLLPMEISHSAKSPMGLARSNLLFADGDVISQEVNGTWRLMCQSGMTETRICHLRGETDSWDLEFEKRK
jgi:hypothetical protein